MKKTKKFVTFGKRIGKKIVSLAACTSIVLSIFSSPTAVTAAENEKAKAVEYYHKAEVLNQEEWIDTYTDLYGVFWREYKDKVRNGYGQLMSLKGTFSEEFAKSSDLFGIKNLELKTETMGKDASGSVKYKFFLNEKQLLECDAYIDDKEKEAYVKFPDLSNAYLKMGTEDMYNSTTYLKEWLENNPFTEEIVNSLLKKYLKIVTDQLNNVALQNNAEVSANGVTSRVNELTVTITGTDLLNIYGAVLKEASTDETLAFLCEQLGYCTQKEYVKTVNELIEELEELKAEEALELEEYDELYGEDWDTMFCMKVWVDVNNKIVGRKFYFSDEEEESFGYLFTSDGAKKGFEAWNADSFRIRAEGIIDASSKYSGKAVIDLVDYYEEKTDTYTIDIKNADFKNLVEGYIDGTFTFTDNKSKNTRINIACVGSPKWQNIKYDVVKDDVSQFSVEVDSKDVFFAGFHFPSDAEQIFDAETESDRYLETVDLEGFLKGIEDKIENSELKAIFSERFKGVIDEEFSN